MGPPPLDVSQGADSNGAVTYPERQYSALEDEFDLIHEVERQTGMSLVFLVDVEIPLATTNSRENEYMHYNC